MKVRTITHIDLEESPYVVNHYHAGDLVTIEYTYASDYDTDTVRLSGLTTKARIELAKALLATVTDEVDLTT